MENTKKPRETHREELENGRTKEEQARWEAQKKKDHTLVKGRFHFKEVPNGTLVFSFVRYKGDPIYRYELKDGEIYTLPYMIAKHLATGCYEDVYTNQKDANGKDILAATSKRHRTGFERLDFDDENFVPSNIIMADTRLITNPI